MIQNTNNEVERLGELLNRAIEMAEEAIRLADIDYENDKFGKVIWLKKEVAEIETEARLATAPEETVIQNSRTTESEWRIKEKGEIIETDDQYNSPMAGWVSAPWVGEKIETSGRIRTRRPLPKQEEMPIEQNIDMIDTPCDWSDIEARHITATCIRYLRDEIQKLKENR
jgi:hypothetical protein